MAATLFELKIVENPVYGVDKAHNQWVEIFDAAKQVFATQSSKGALYAEYEATLAEGIVKNINAGYTMDMHYGYDSANAYREALHELAHSGNIQGLYAELESKALIRGDVSYVYKALQAELGLAKAVKLTAQETALMESSLAVENVVASRALTLLEAGASAAYGVGAAEIVVGVKAWLDQLPETDLPSPQILALRQYVEQHGPEHANDHTLGQYMQNAAPAP